MSQNKRRKMDLGATNSSASANIQEMSTSVLDDGGEPHIAQQTARANYRAGSRSINKNEEEKVFKGSTFSFREAVKWSGFVDRTLLLKDLLENDENSVIIYAPKRFGKSMNVSMVKCFFEIEKGRDVTKVPRDLKELEKFENFKAFMRYGIKEPCKILEEVELVKEHFGRHPVIHLNFLRVKISSIQVVEDSLRQLVHFAYLEHDYLEDGKIFAAPRANEHANERCRIWCNPREYEGKDPIGGLQKLIEYLYAYHKREVYLLVDEFDSPTVKAMMAGNDGKVVKGVSNQVTELLVAVLKDETFNGYLLGSLITGVSHLGSVGISPTLNNVPRYKWLMDPTGRFAPYYGLSEDELKILLAHVFPNEQERDSIQKEVKELYNGYITFQNDSVYCLWSVLHYIRIRLTIPASEILDKSFWGGSDIVGEMGSLLKNSNIMSKMITLMGGDCIYIKPRAKVDAQQLANLLNKSESCSSDLVFTFFMEQGYLTLVPNERGVHRSIQEIRVKIPNEDVTNAFKVMFENFSSQICGFDDDIMEKCAELFRDLPRSRNVDIFKEKLELLYPRLTSLLQIFNKLCGVNEGSLQAALFVTMLKAGFNECSVEQRVKVDPNRGRIDLWMFDGYNAFIFELKFIESDDDEKLQESALQALKEILSGSKTKKVPYVEILGTRGDLINYILIGISVNHKGKICMCFLVNSEKAEDCTWLPK